MRKAIANQTYRVLALDENGNTDDSGCLEIDVDQYKGDFLEIWKTRKSDGFHFVYCNRLGIGYWVLPALITEID